MRAIALFSGGLDSTLAAKLIQNQGIEVLALHINTGFGATKERESHMRYMCEQIGVAFESINIENEYVQDVLFSPKYGYGKNFNPCIDCHAKMFAVAKRLLEAKGASFLISGEVLGQRPMSQNLDALKTVLKESGCEDLLLRPLSAKKLPQTLPEREGWVNRELLGEIHGRSRDAQLLLAKEYGLKDFDHPGGGCLLTDESFGKKMFDFIKYDTFDVSDIPFMKYGRHLRLDDGAKLIIGRNEKENNVLIELVSQKYLHISPDGFLGPHGRLSVNATPRERAVAAKIIITYGKTLFNQEYRLLFDTTSHAEVGYASKEAVARYMVL